MNQRQKNAARLALAGMIFSAAAAALIVRCKSFFATAEESVQAYMYDQSEQRLYAAPRGTLAPDAGVGGERGDGVRAVVVAPRGGETSRLRVAYLEMYAPSLHEKLAAVQAARKAGQGALVSAMSGDDPFVLKNTLVRREHESTWHDMTTPQARKIITEWMSWRDDAGRPLVVVTP